MLNKLWRVASIQPEAGDSVKTRHYEVGTESGSDRVTIWQSQFSQSAATRSHPPPHAGCPRGDPGPLSVLTSSPWRSSLGDRQSLQRFPIPLRQIRSCFVSTLTETH